MITRYQRRALVLLSFASSLSLAIQARASDDVCSQLLAHGIFDTRDTTVASANRERLSTLFCREDSATLQSAKQNASSGGVDLPGILSATGDHSESESNYQQFRTSLCHTADYAYDSSFFMQEHVTRASKDLLETFNSCINRKGLKQYLTTDGSQSGVFVWNIVYDPIGSMSSIKVMLNSDPKKICTLDGKLAPAKVKVDAAGVRLLCKPNTAHNVVLTLNSHDAAPTPPAVFVDGQPQERDAPWITFGPFDAPPNMRAPISIPLPWGMECKQASAVGAWHPHCDNTNVVSSCPPLRFSEGQASSDFDAGAYGDNCDAANTPHCSYKVACREIISRRKSAVVGQPR